MDVNHKRFAAHAFGADRRQKGHPIVGVNDIEVRLAGDHLGGLAVARDFGDQIAAVRSHRLQDAVTPQAAGHIALGFVKDVPRTPPSPCRGAKNGIHDPDVKTLEELLDVRLLPRGDEHGRWPCSSTWDLWPTIPRPRNNQK